MAREALEKSDLGDPALEQSPAAAELKCQWLRPSRAYPARND
jgi:hypothetical protein